MEPNVILVDLADRPLGEMPKGEAHAQPRLHRAFSVFLYHDNKMLLQQRALTKYHGAGLWANACCSHPRMGEDLRQSAQKRLLEETGIVHNGLEHIFAFPYFARLGESIYEYEYDHVFLGEYEGGFTPNASEVASMRRVEIPRLVRDMQDHPLQYAPWFLICAPRVIEIISKRQ